MYLNKNMLRSFVAMTATLFMLSFSACTAKPAPKAREDSTANGAPSSLSANHFDGGTYCVQTFIQGTPPAQPLHFSNKVTQSDQSLKTKDYEADLAGDTLDVIDHDQWLATDEDRKLFEDTQKFDDPKMIARAIHNGVAEETVTNHYSRSDASGWRMASTSLAQGATPWNLFVSKPTVHRVGPENVNGYDAIKYAVDTTHDSQIEKAALLMASRLKDYNITGNAWVVKDVNCVLQYDLNFEQEGKDGKVSKTHYEGTVTKK